MVEKLIRACHLRGYIREPAHIEKTAPAVERITNISKLMLKPRPTINYILGEPADDLYQSKRQRRKLLRASIVRTRANTINTPDNSRAVQPIDGPISFSPINPSKVITPHHDALVLTLCINNFDIHRVLVDLDSATDLL